MSTELKTVAWAATSEEGEVEALGMNESRRFDSALVLRSEAEAEIARLRAALQDAMLMIHRIKGNTGITNNAGYTPDGRMLTLAAVEEAARAALNPGEQNGR